MSIEVTCFFADPLPQERKRVQKRTCNVETTYPFERLGVDDEFREPLRLKKLPLVVKALGKSSAILRELVEHAETLSLFDEFNSRFPKHNIQLLEKVVYFYQGVYLVAQPNVSIAPERTDDSIFEAFQHFCYEKKNILIQASKVIGFSDYYCNIALEKPNVVKFFKGHICSEICTSLHLLRHPLQPDYVLSRHIKLTESFSYQSKHDSAMKAYQRGIDVQKKNEIRKRLQQEEEEANRLREEIVIMHQRKQEEQKKEQEIKQQKIEEERNRIEQRLSEQDKEKEINEKHEKQMQDMKQKYDTKIQKLEKQKKDDEQHVLKLLTERMELDEKNRLEQERLKAEHEEVLRQSELEKERILNESAMAKLKMKQENEAQQEHLDNAQSLRDRVIMEVSGTEKDLKALLGLFEAHRDKVSNELRDITAELKQMDEEDTVMRD